MKPPDPEGELDVRLLAKEELYAGQRSQLFGTEPLPQKRAYRRSIDDLLAGLKYRPAAGEPPLSDA